MPRCKKCGFATDDIEEFVRHVFDERFPEAEEEPVEKKRHKTIEEFLNCPTCFPRFEKAFLERGYTKPEEKPQKKKPFPF